MKKIFTKNIIFILFLICSTNISICLEKEYITKEKIYINNINSEVINIEPIDIVIDDSSILLDEVYNASAIITVNVKNNSLEDIELANLDVYPYQDNLPIKYFVSTYKNDINGFIGNLKSGESKTLKMGATLHNTKDPIRLEFYNIEDTINNNIEKDIK